MMQSKLMKAVVFGAALLMPVINAASNAGDGAESGVAVGQRREARGESMAQRAETAISLTSDNLPPMEDSLGGNETESDSFGATGGGETRVRRNTKEEEDLRKAQEQKNKIDVNVQRGAATRKDVDDLKLDLKDLKLANKATEARIKNLKLLGTGVVGAGLLIGGAAAAVAEGIKAADTMGAEKFQEQTLGFDANMVSFTMGVIAAALGLMILTGLANYAIFGNGAYFYIIQMCLSVSMICTVAGAFTTEISGISTGIRDAWNYAASGITHQDCADPNWFFYVAFVSVLAAVVAPLLLLGYRKWIKC